MTTRIKAERLALTLTYLHVADIQGIGEFPVRMLTTCQPFAVEDAAAIYSTLLIGSRGRPYAVRIKKYAPTSIGWAENELARWQAEGCTVTPVNPSDSRPAVPNSEIVLTLNEGEIGRCDSPQQCMHETH